MLLQLHAFSGNPLVSPDGEQEVKVEDKGKSWNTFTDETCREFSF